MLLQLCCSCLKATRLAHILDSSALSSVKTGLVMLTPCQHMVISAEKVLIGWFCSRKKLQLPRVVSEREVKSFSHLIIWGLRYVLYDSHSLRDFSGSISCDLFCIPKALTSLNNHHDLWLNGAVGHSIVPGKVWKCLDFTQAHIIVIWIAATCNANLGQGKSLCYFVLFRCAVDSGLLEFVTFRVSTNQFSWTKNLEAKCNVSQL